MLIALDFDKDRTSIFADGTILEFSEGIKGKGLLLGASKINDPVQNADTSWFSSLKDFSVALRVKSLESTKDTTIILSNAYFGKSDMGIRSSFVLRWH